MEVTKKLKIPLCDITLYQPEFYDFSKYSIVNQVKKYQIEPEEEITFNETQENFVKDEFPQNMKSSRRMVQELENEESDVENSLETNLSEYEKMVQKNREEKMAFLQSLKINEVKEEFKEVVETLKPKRKISTPKSIKRPRLTEVTPVRKSRRLAKLDINLSEEALYENAIKEAVEEIEKKIIPRRYPFKLAIHEEEDYTDFISKFEFKVEEDVKFNCNHASRFKHLKLKESNIAKVVPTRVSALAVHPTTEKVVVIAGSKRGHLGFWNVTSDSNPIVFSPHDGGITNVKVNPNNALQIISSSYDGTVRCGDVEKQIFNEIYNVSEETCCTYFDFLSPTTFLVAQRNGIVSVIDVRDDNLKSEKKHMCHDKSVKTVSVHPTKKSLFLTADSKGSMKLWDLRKLQTKAMITIEHHKRSLSSAFFSPVTGDSILTTSADDSLCIFDSSNVGTEILFDKSIKHNNFTGRWLTPFKATWLPNSDDAFVVGSMDYPRKIEIYDNKLKNIYNFLDENLTSVTSVNEFHPHLNLLAGANSSGKIFIFTDSELNF